MKQVSKISVAELIERVENMPKKYKMNRNRWARLSFNEQMGNIGSEVGRSLSYLKKNDSEMAKAAMARAIDLFDATTANSKLTPARRKETLRAKEEYLRAFFEDADRPGIENYFMQFAIAARINR